jgi:hypothetical protein
MAEGLAQDRLSQLRAIDPAVLREVVRQDQRNPSFEVTDWSVDHLSNKGMISEDSLFLFRGEGRNGKGMQPWSVVLKILQAPDEERDLRDLVYWRRELLLAQHGLRARGCGALAAPRIYGAADYGTSAWLWMEHLTESGPAHWTLGQYAFAACTMGRANAVCLNGGPIPDFPWLAQGHARWFATVNEPLRWLEDPAVPLGFGETLTRRLRELLDEIDRFSAALSALPQVFSHGDTQRRNLFICHRDGQDELVAVDWAACGRRAIGEDLWGLVGGSVMVREWEPDAVAELDAIAYPAYLAGLAEAGWSGDPDLVRLGYTAGTALGIGATMPLGLGLFAKEEMRELDMRKFGLSPEELSRGWVKLEAYSLQCADEARQIMDRLGW